MEKGVIMPIQGNPAVPLILEGIGALQQDKERKRRESLFETRRQEDITRQEEKTRSQRKFSFLTGLKDLTPESRTQVDKSILGMIDEKDFDLDIQRQPQQQEQLFRLPENQAKHFGLDPNLEWTQKDLRVVAEKYVDDIRQQADKDKGRVTIKFAGDKKQGTPDSLIEALKTSMDNNRRLIQKTGDAANIEEMSQRLDTAGNLVRKFRNAKRVGHFKNITDNDWLELQVLGVDTPKGKELFDKAIGEQEQQEQDVIDEIHRNMAIDEGRGFFSIDTPEEDAAQAELERLEEENPELFKKAKETFKKDGKKKKQLKFE